MSAIVGFVWRRVECAWGYATNGKWYATGGHAAVKTNGYKRQKKEQIFTFLYVAILSIRCQPQ